MDFIRIKNLRSLEDTGRIQLKPITILVGTNSSGKSSFLRAFPLLKQSIETPTDSPLLWYGRYTDFGSLGDAASRTRRDKNITIEFGFDLAGPIGYAMDEFAEPTPRDQPEPIPVTISFTLGPAETSDGARITEYNIDFDGVPIHLEVSHNTQITKFTSGKFDALAHSPTLVFKPSAFILPSIQQTIGTPPQRRRTVFQPYFPTQQPSPLHFYTPYTGPFLLPAIKDSIRPLLHGRSNDETISYIASRLMAGRPSWMLRQLSNIHGPSSWTNNTSALTTDSKTFLDMRDRVIANAIPLVLDLADRRIAEFAASVGYMGPLRATAQRYYRIQDLAVHELDFQGENLAMFLRSLSDAQRQQFASFSKRYFHFEVFHKSSGGHVELLLKEDQALDGINLADMGFGYSQVLPVIAQLWSSAPQRRKSARRVRKRLLAIEQPELHLHPAYQTKIADMLAGIALETNRSPTSLIVETHSEAIINRLGELIREQQLPANSVQILLFSKSPQNPTSSIQTAGFHEDGALKDWPYGFFSSHN